jgi:hypothetical protein
MSCYASENELNILMFRNQILSAAICGFQQKDTSSLSTGYSSSEYSYLYIIGAG